MRKTIIVFIFIVIALLSVLYSYAYIENNFNDSLQIKEAALKTTQELTVVPLEDTLVEKIDLSVEKNGAFFNTDGKLFYYDALTDSVVQIASEGYPKYNAQVSPNGRYILYNHSLVDTHKNGKNELMIGVCDFEGNVIHNLTIDTMHSNDILAIEWINDNYFAVTCHVNPSTSEYFMYSMENGEQTAYYNGYSFTVIDNADIPDIMYAVNVPHGFGEKAYHSYAINGEVVYTSESMGATLSKVSVSDDKNKLAFIENFAFDSEEYGRPLLVLMDKVDGTICLQRKIQIPQNVHGYLSFDEENNVILTDGNKLFKLDEKNEFELNYIMSNEEAKEEDIVNRFKDVTIEKIGFDLYSDISNVVWFE